MQWLRERPERRQRSWLQVPTDARSMTTSNVPDFCADMRRRSARKTEYLPGPRPQHRDRRPWQSETLMLSPTAPTIRTESFLEPTIRGRRILRTTVQIQIRGD